MATIIRKIEDRTANRYGLEARRTIWVFTVTEALRKLFKIEG